MISKTIGKRILVFNVNWVGDVIFTTPIFKALKNAYPQSHIACMAVPRVKEISESAPQVDEVIVYDEDGRHRSLLGKGKLVFELRKRKFDTVFLLHRSWTRAFMVYLAGIPYRIGYDSKHRGFFLTHKIPLTMQISHRSDYYLNIVESYGIPVNDRACELIVDQHARSQITRWLEREGIMDNDYLVIVHIGGNWDLKRWPKENFAGLIKSLIQDLGLKVAIPGAPKDVELANEIKQKSQSHPVVMAGKTNLKQLIALMERADLVISSDSGPIHIANCVGTDVIGLFGPTRPAVTGPRGRGKVMILQKELECNREPCYKLNCSDNLCMRAISPEDVLGVVKQINKRKD